MNLIVANIENYAASRVQFRFDELWRDLNRTEAIGKTMLSWYLKKMVEGGKLSKADRGVYSSKQTFVLIPDEKSIKLHKELKKHFPFLELCIYEGGFLSSLEHHLAPNAITYVEVSKDATKAVFHFLQDNGNTKTYLQPSHTFINDYIDMGQPAVFVKPIVSEAPLQKAGEIQVPTLEKILVDIHCDDDFFYLQGGENRYIMEAALKLYPVNTAKLLRYAGRRGVKEEMQEMLNQIAMEI